MGFKVVGNPTTDKIISSLSFHSKYFFAADIATKLAELPEFTITQASWFNTLPTSISNS